MERLSGKVAIVTGAGQGIGAALATALAQSGARVVVADLSGENAVSVSDAINRGAAGESVAIGVQVDIASRPSVEAMVARAVDAFGTVDVLVNNAAVWKGLQRRAFWEVPTEEWDHVLAVNTRGPFFCCCAVAPIMARHGGRIIFIGSATIGTAQATLTHYTTSKAALIGLMRCVARELGPQNVCVNMVHPGLTDLGGVERDYLEARSKNKFIQRVGMPDDLTGAVVFLASDESAFITGQQLFVDGGGILN